MSTVRPPAYARVEERQIARIQRRREENYGKPVTAPRAVRMAETAEDLADMTASFEGFTYSPAGDKRGRELFEAFYSDPGHIPQTHQVA